MKIMKRWKAQHALIAAVVLFLSGRASAQGGQVIVSEIVAKNNGSFTDENGGKPDWIELYNSGSSTVDLGNYKLTDTKSTNKSWTIPEGTTIGGGKFLVVAADGTGQSGTKYIHTDFKLSSEGGYVALLSPSGDVISEVYYPDLDPDKSFGATPGSSSGGSLVKAQDSTTATAQSSGGAYAILSKPTPGSTNAGPQSGLGPTIVNTSNGPKPRPSGGDITVTTSVLPQVDPISKVELVYVIGYGPETTVPMTASSDGKTYSFTIPAAVATPGALVRWYVRAADSNGKETRDPKYKDPLMRQYYGTIVLDTSDPSSLPVVDLYCKDEKAPYNAGPNYKQAAPQCSLLLDGEFFDNLVVRRRGVSSLTWPKPKFKIDAGKQGKIFKIKKGAPKVKGFNLNSEWAEPGENTFMRETLAWKTLKAMGVDNLVSYQTQVRLNGKYYGKFALGEMWGEDQLMANGYGGTHANPGPFFKSTSGEYSNLRWDIPPDKVTYYYEDVTKSGRTGDLVDFGKGLAGGGPEPRSKYLFDWVNLPRTINNMAAQTLVLNQDRCTKNFYVYLDPSTQQWSMLPWDIEQSFGSDRGLGGIPAPDYCILACEQWNSPLYCDSRHPQDLVVTSPWGLITAQINPDTPATSYIGSGGRKLMQGSSSSSSSAGTTAGTATNGAAKPGLQLPSNSSIPADYDVDQTKKGPTLTGAPGTFNYLMDALLMVPRTRAMYMRRLRTLMDEFIATGRLEQLVKDEYAEIKDEAARDVAKWGNPGSADRGYQQLITLQLPLRKQQLYNLYGPGSDTPLIPDAQPSGAAVSIGSVGTGSDGYVQVVNGNDFAVDVSGWSLGGGGIAFTFIPGTVIPAQDSVYVAATNVYTFKTRKVSPSGGQGLFIVGPLNGTPTGGASDITISPAS